MSGPVSGTPSKLGGADMKPYSERIPFAIAKGRELLAGNEVVLYPPHMGGNDTAFTVALTAGEVALAEALWGELGGVDQPRGWEPPPALIAYIEKVERIESHD